VVHIDEIEESQLRFGTEAELYDDIENNSFLVVQMEEVSIKKKQERVLS